MKAMKEADAIAAAIRFFRNETSREPHLIGANKIARYPDQWSVLFENRNAEGKLFDGPIIVIVHNDGSIRFF